MKFSADKVHAQSPAGSEALAVPVYLRANYNQHYLSKVSELLEVNVESNNSAVLRGFIARQSLEYASPFSAPFGGFWPIQGDPCWRDYRSLGERFIAYLVSRKASVCRLTLPSVCYDPNGMTNQIRGLLSAGFSIDYADISHSLNIAVDFKSRLHRNGKRSLKNALTHDLVFTHCESDDDSRRVYEVIRVNREQKKYPLKLSYVDILPIKEFTTIDFFLVTVNSVDIAGAIVYRVSEDIGQVVYWGHDVRYGDMNPVHFLAMNLSEFYKDKIRMLDIGPSSIEGVFDEGLCRFKESLGCDVSMKYTLSYTSSSTEQV
ncbi:MAG: hypothetical protein ACJA0W_003772 [Candidatus Azotimanducaceae bacterium]|jgi:hypothetical protein